MKRHGLPIFLIATLSLALYANTLKNGFVYDDDVTIVNNSFIKVTSNIAKLLTKGDYFAFSGEQTYRPVVTFTYFLDYIFFSLKPWGYHLTNILLHTVNGVLLYIFLVLITCKETDNRKPEILVGRVHKLNNLFLYFSPEPLFITLLFVAHPVLTETVNAVSYREDLLAFLFYVTTMSLYLILRLNKTAHSLVIYALSCLMYTLALLSKEMAVTLPIIIFCYGWVFGKKREGLNRYNIGYIIITILYLFTRFYYFYNPIEGKIITSSLTDRLLSVPYLLLSDLKLSIFPVSLSADYEILPVRSIFSPLFIVPLLGVVSLSLTLFFKSTKINRALLFGILFFIITLIPVYNIVPIANVLAERYLYLPMVGFMISVGTAINMFKDRNCYWRISLIIIILCIYSLAVVSRNRIWSNDLLLWSDTVKKSDSSRSHNNLGIAYAKAGRFNEAIKEFQIALRHKDDVDTHNNLGLAYTEMGRLDEAIRELQLAIGLNDDYSNAYNNLGNVYVKQEMLDQAIKEFLVAIRLKPNDPRYHYNLANVYYRQRRYTEAIEEFLIALRFGFDNSDIHNNLGLVYQDIGKVDEAITQYQNAIKLNPNYINAHYNLGNVYLDKGLKVKARTEFKIALSLQPDFLPAKTALESLD